MKNIFYFCAKKLTLFSVIIITLFLLTSCVNTHSDVSSNENTPSTDVSTPNDEASQINLLDTMDSETFRGVNSFLSNFSEAGYKEFVDFYGEDESKISFAYIHALINYNKLTFYEGNYMGISASDVDEILNKFFGATVPHETPSNSQYWFYQDGKFLMPAAGGESYSKFSIAYNMTSESDGVYTIDFNVFSDPSVTGGNIITDKSVYSLTSDEASNKYQPVGHGQAVVKTKVYEGKEIFELISYSVKMTW